MVATPIGNLQDITLRALSMLAGVDWIAAEDTRETRKLLNRHGIRARMVSLFGDVERGKAPQLVRALERGESGAVVSTAGTPGASDPGSVIVAAAAARGIRVSPVPGPSAIAAAFSASGLESTRFVFEGFLPRSGGKRARAIESFVHERRHVIFFESARRIRETLSELHEKLGDRGVTLFREMTKVYEQITRTTLGAAAGGDVDVKEIGEYTVIIHGIESKDESEDIRVAEMSRVMEALCATELSVKDIAFVVSDVFGISKNRAYEAVKEYR